MPVPAKLKEAMRSLLRRTWDRIVLGKRYDRVYPISYSGMNYSQAPEKRYDQHEADRERYQDETRTSVQQVLDKVNEMTRDAGHRVAKQAKQAAKATQELFAGQSNVPPPSTDGPSKNCDTLVN